MSQIVLSHCSLYYTKVLRSPAPVKPLRYEIINGTLTSNNTGVYTIYSPKNYIFPLKYSEDITSSLVFPPHPFIFAVFLNKPSYFPPIQVRTPGEGQNKKYTGVNIFPKYDIQANPLILKWQFFPRYSENVLFSHYPTSSPLYSRFFLRNHHIFIRVVPDIRLVHLPDIRLNCWTNDANF